MPLAFTAFQSMLYWYLDTSMPFTRPLLVSTTVGLPLASNLYFTPAMTFSVFTSFSWVVGS